jgi:hypothetical protein
MMIFSKRLGRALSETCFLGTNLFPIQAPLIKAPSLGAFQILVLPLPCQLEWSFVLECFGELFMQLRLLAPLLLP